MAADSSNPTRVSDGGSNNDPEYDSDVAAELAIDHLRTELAHPEEGTHGDLERLNAQCGRIVSALREGEEPSKEDVVQAKFYTERVVDHLEDVARLHGWNRMYAGFSWGELTDDEQTEYRRWEGSEGDR